MLKLTKKEKKLQDSIVAKSYDTNHITHHYACDCREEAFRRMTRTILLVQEYLEYYNKEDLVMTPGAVRDLQDKIKTSLEEEE